MGNPFGLRLRPTTVVSLSNHESSNQILGVVQFEAAIAEYRSRLTNLSWLMKSLSKPIARKANAEEKVSGRFWEGRFRCQALLSEKSILAAMTYVDLNPVRANIAEGIGSSRYTSAKARHLQILRDQSKASAPLMPLIVSNHSMCQRLRRLSTLI